MDGMIINNMTGLVDDVRKWGRSPEIRGMELPGVVKTGLLLIISGIVVGGGMSRLWSLGCLIDPFEELNAKVIGSNATCLSILFAIALMIWWFVMNFLVPYRRERWRSWIKWRIQLSKGERLLLSEMFKLRYSLYVEKQGEKRLTPTNKDRQILKEKPDKLTELVSIDEVSTLQELAEWIRKNWGRPKSDLYKDWKKKLQVAEERGGGGEAVELGLKLCKMLDGDPPEGKVLLNLIEENFAIVKKDKNDYPHAPNLKYVLTAMFDEDEDKKPWPEFFFKKRRRHLSYYGFIKILGYRPIDHTEGKERVVIKEVYQITLPAWYLLEHLERRGSLP